MFENVKADFDRYCQIDYGVSCQNCKNKLKVWFHGYGLQALAAYRFYRWSLQGSIFCIRLCKLPLIVIGFFVHQVVGSMYDIKISPKAKIGSGCYIGHFGGIRIGRCTIGNWCNINHQIEIMNTVAPNGFISIEDRVWIGAHSKISGNIRIGAGSAISAGSYVTADVPGSVLVAGVSNRILKRNYDNCFLLGLEKNK